MQRLAVVVAGSIEPVLAVELRHVHDQRVAFPAADRVPHVGQIRRSLHLIEVNRSARARELERHLDLVRALHDLKGVGHVHRARNAGQIALQLRIAVDPMVCVLLLDLRRLRLVRDRPVAFDDAHRSGHATRCAERKHGRRCHARVRIWIDAFLGDRTRSRLMGLEVPMSFVERLPDAVEIRLAVSRARGRRRRRPPTTGSRHTQRDDSANRRGRDSHGNRRTRHRTRHDALLIYSADWLLHRHLQIRRRIRRSPRCTD